MTKQESLIKFDVSVFFTLPGKGEPHKNEDGIIDCGSPVYIGHQSGDKIHYVKKHKSCHRFDCPVCWKDWQKREALSAVDRLAHYSNLYNRKMVHYVVSPPQSRELHTMDDYRTLRRQAYKIAKLRGIKGGWMIFHERALRYSDPDAYAKTHCSEGFHFHILGDGWLSNTKEFFLDDGWIVKNLRVRSKRGVYNTAFYILDHAVKASNGYPAISQSTVPKLATSTWFGTMSYNKLKIEKYKGSDKIYCPICEKELARSEWYHITWNDKDPPDNNYGEGEISPNAFLIDYPITEWSGFYQ